MARRQRQMCIRDSDGAPLDAMVIMDEPTFAGCLIKARPIGVVDLHDCGAYDGKLLCVPIAILGRII